MYCIKTAILVALGALGAAAPCAADAGADSLPQTVSVTDQTTAQEGKTTDQTTASGGAANTEIVYDDPNLVCYRFTAYRSPDLRGEKYLVPSRPDLYVGFNIKAPWTGTRYVKSLRALTDNRKVVHHMILFRNLNGGIESIIEDARGTHPDGEMLYGWSPGTSDLWLHPDVGMEAPGGSVFQLETHYNNLSGAPVPDASGVELCVTSTQPQHVASMSYLGADVINGISATGHCTHESKQPIHLVLGLPHMHKKGVHMKVDLIRAAGGVETIHDLPFDFEYQRSYVLNNVVVQPGDKLTTTCTYAEPARFGKGTSDEMCYFFSVHWPAGALARKSFFNAYHGPNTCIDD